jgi:endonuclease YncB( thermonuclease family)
MLRLLPVILALAALGAHAQTLAGRVVKVSDGDTLTLLDAAQRQHKVRLAAIDAPEKDQAFGRRSRESLAAMCAGQAAVVLQEGKDRYGRVVGRVTCGRIDANSEQVRHGMAWVYHRYAPAGSPLYRLQAEAQAGRRGLWYDARPQAPWAWRAERRTRAPGARTI